MLPLEVTVLRALRANNAKYYPGYESCGQTDRFNYVVMGLVGKNINELRKTMPQKRFTIRSCLHIGSRSVLSLSEIHKAGFLHRDLKPANMCIGRAPHDLKSVYILDWGLCRKYLNELGKPHRPRIKAGFRGTPWYASVNALSGQDQGRVDDMWSWFFGLVELTVGKLPWDDGEKAPPEAKKYIAWLAQKKAAAIAEADIICAGCPREFQDQYALLKEMDFYAEPLYEKFVESLAAVMTRKCIAEDFPLDWEPNAALARLTTKVPDATMLHRPNENPTSQ
uniref:non-specific serine/threonine protein kinase n=1 Tax=Romanomermis culicivorax TaxID=13658 RepID=A0A915K4D4_ROMCU